MNDLTLELTPAERRAFRAEAHHLQPVVAIGQHGLTPAVLHEVDLALQKHQLIKVRVFADDRGTRESLLQSICTELGCLPVQHLGKLLILYRVNPELKDAAAKKSSAATGGKARSKAKSGIKDKGKKTYKVRNAAHTPVDPVRERRRTTADGTFSGKGRRGAARHQGAGDAPPAEAVRGRRASATDTLPADARRGRRASAADAPAADITRRRYAPAAAPPSSASDTTRRRRAPAGATPAADTTRRRRKAP